MMSVGTWYHCSVKLISRSTGRTAIAAAAYRSGTKLHDEQLEKTYDYTRRRGIETSFIVAPDSAPEWAYQLERLWNEAQAKDNRKNSCLAREIELALPSQLDASDREQIAREFALHLVERYGVAVSVALHEPSRYGDDRNYHAHIMMTTRRMNENGFGQKTRELDDRKIGSHEITHIREYASMLINRSLEEAGFEERVDHRSFEDRGIDQIPTEHLGVKASAMERRGERTELGDHNREVLRHNQVVDSLVSELAALDAEIAEEMEKSFLPTAEEEEREAQEVQRGQPEAAARSVSANSIITVYDKAFLSSSLEQQRQAQNVQPGLPEDERSTQSAFTDSSIAVYEANIRDRGEIREFGLGKSWIDRTIVLLENIYYGTMERIRDAWQKHVSRDVYRPAQDRDIELDK